MSPGETDSWSAEGLPYLNVAAICLGTYALGPGYRAALWVQGCSLSCDGCIAPDWIPRRTARLAEPADLANELLAHPQVTGLTFSGGEPMLQAAGLAEVAHLARLRRDLDIICFTGRTLGEWRRRATGPGVGELLEQIDLLIDGPYIARLNDNRGLSGSSNQRFHYLTDRLRYASEQLEYGKRRAEVRLSTDEVMLVGVPPQGVLQTFQGITWVAGADHLLAEKGDSK